MRYGDIGPTQAQCTNPRNSLNNPAAWFGHYGQWHITPIEAQRGEGRIVHGRADAMPDWPADQPDNIGCGGQMRGHDLVTQPNQTTMISADLFVCFDTKV